MVSSDDKQVAVRLTDSSYTLPADAPDTPAPSLNIYQGILDSAVIDGAELSAGDIASSPEKYGFERSPVQLTDENGDVNTYYVRYLMETETDMISGLAGSIPLNTGTFGTVKDLLMSGNADIMSGMVAVSVNEATGESTMVSELFSFAKEMYKDDLTKDEIGGAVVGLLIDCLGKGAQIGGNALNVIGVTIQNACYVYKTNAEFKDRIGRINYRKDPRIKANAGKLMTVAATVQTCRVLTAVGNVAATVALAVAGTAGVIATGPAIVIGAALTFAAWCLGELYSDVENDLDKKLCRATPKGNINMMFDPSGIAYEWLPSNPVEGVTAEIYYQDEKGKAVLWNAGDYDQVNPQITDAAGWFAWDVPEGMWQVRIKGEGYEDAESEWLPVLPVQTDVNIKLTSKAAAEIADAGYRNGLVLVKFTKHMLDSTVTADSLMLKTKDGKTVPCSITAIKEEGNDTEASMMFGLTPEEAIEPDSVKVYVTSGAESYAGVSCKNNKGKKLRTMSEDEIPDITEHADPDLGDVNGDGIINAVDASRILVLYAALSAGEAEVTDKDFATSDINGDKLINAVDASLVLAFYASLAQTPDLTLGAFLEERKQ